MASFVSPLKIAIVSIAVVAAGVGSCSTYGPQNPVAAANGVPCAGSVSHAMALNGNFGGAIGGRMILGATSADDKPLCDTR